MPDYRVFYMKVDGTDLTRDDVVSRDSLDDVMESCPDDETILFMEEVGTHSFVEAVYEIAYGEDAINKGYTFEEVIATLRGFSDKALEVEDEDTRGDS